MYGFSFGVHTLSLKNVLRLSNLNFLQSDLETINCFDVIYP